MVLASTSSEISSSALVHSMEVPAADTHIYTHTVPSPLLLENTFMSWSLICNVCHNYNININSTDMFSVACATLKCKTCLQWQSCWSSSDWCCSLHSKAKIIKYYKYIKPCVADKQEQTKTFREEFTTWLRFTKDSSQALKWFTGCNSKIKPLLQFWKPLCGFRANIQSCSAVQCFLWAVY